MCYICLLSFGVFFLGTFWTFIVAPKSTYDSSDVSTVCPRLWCQNSVNKVSDMFICTLCEIRLTVKVEVRHTAGTELWHKSRTSLYYLSNPTTLMSFQFWVRFPEKPYTWCLRGADCRSICYRKTHNFSSIGSIIFNVLLLYYYSGSSYGPLPGGMCLECHNSWRHPNQMALHTEVELFNITNRI